MSTNWLLYFFLESGRKVKLKTQDKDVSKQVNKEVVKELAAFQKRLAAGKLTKRDKEMIKKGS